MPDYALGKIYKLESDTNSKIYIGSTAKDKLSQRLQLHYADYKRYLEGKQHYITSYEILKQENCRITLVEEYPCVSKEELLKRERYWIEKHKDICVNAQIPSRTKKEHYIDNKEKIRKKHKAYTELHKEQIRTYNKSWRDQNKCKIENYRKIEEQCECGQMIKRYLKAEHKQSLRHQKAVLSIAK